MTLSAFPSGPTLARGSVPPLPLQLVRQPPPAPEALGEADIRRALQGGTLTMVYQPVVDLRTGRIVGTEALARFQSETYRTPDVWFAEAERCGLGLELELAAVRAALANAAGVPDGVYIAVNVAPRTLISASLRELLAAAPGERVVLEVTEHARVDDYAALQKAVTFYRSRGMRLAIDDAGAGYASFQHIVQLRPDIIKLDRCLTTGVDSNPVRFALASSLVTFAASLGARICAEGIETSAELVALQQRGVEYGQGYFLARPNALPLRAPPVGIWFLPETCNEEAAGDRAGAAPRRLPSPGVRSASRLASLRATQLMDSEAEEDFDRFTRLAARLLKAPVGLVSLVDDRRQFFKSAHGLGLRETPLTHSFCAHVVTARTALVVGDSSLHPLVKNNPVVDELGVAAYAGVPLITADDEALGSFCVVDVKPRTWTEDDIVTLREIGAMASAQIDLRKSVQELERRASLVDALFECGEQGVAILGLDLVVNRTNTALCALLERPEEGLVGKALSTLTEDAEAAGLFAARDEMLSGRKSEVSLVAVHVTAGGPPVELSMVVRIVRDSAGVPNCFLLTARRNALAVASAQPR